MATVSASRPGRRRAGPGLLPSRLRSPPRPAPQRQPGHCHQEPVCTMRDHSGGHVSPMQQNTCPLRGHRVPQTQTDSKGRRPRRQQDKGDNAGEGLSRLQIEPSDQPLVCPSPDLSPAAAVFRTLYQMPGNGVTAAWPPPSKARPGASSGCPAPSPARGEAKALLTAAVRRARGAARAVSPGAQTPAETRWDVASCTRSPANGRGFLNM